MNSKEKWKHYYTTNICREKGDKTENCPTLTKNKDGSYTNNFESIKDFFELVYHYKQVSCGLTHNIRNVVVIDVDENIKNPLYFSKELPILPNMYNWNKKNGHCQFYYFLKESVLYNSKQWKDMLNYSRYYGDSNFNGWLIRNPFYNRKGYESYVIHENNIDNKLFSKLNIDKQYKSKINIIPNSNISKNNVNRIHPNDSRNTETFFNTGKWLSQYVKDNKNPELETVFNQWKIFNIEVCQKLNKPLSPENEGISTCNQLLKYYYQGKLKFGNKNGISWTNESREISLKIRKENKEYNKNIIRCSLKMGCSRKEIINTYKNISVRTINRYLKEIKMEDKSNNDDNNIPISLCDTNVTIFN